MVNGLAFLIFLLKVTNIKDVIKYHNENHKGTRLLNIKGEAIELASQIIRIAEVN
jgi:hypothetical protein